MEVEDDLSLERRLEARNRCRALPFPVPVSVPVLRMLEFRWRFRVCSVRRWRTRSGKAAAAGVVWARAGARTRRMRAVHQSRTRRALGNASWLTRQATWCTRRSAPSTYPCSSCSSSTGASTRRPCAPPAPSIRASAPPREPKVRTTRHGVFCLLLLRYLHIFLISAKIASYPESTTISP